MHYENFSFNKNKNKIKKKGKENNNQVTTIIHIIKQKKN